MLPAAQAPLLLRRHVDCIRGVHIHGYCRGVLNRLCLISVFVCDIQRSFDPLWPLPSRVRAQSYLVLSFKMENIEDAQPSLSPDY